MKQILIVVLPSCRPSKIKSFFGKYKIAPVPWLFLAQDFNSLKRIENELGSNFLRIDVTKLKDEIVDNIRCYYNSWIDSLNRLNGQNLEWWFGAISSRDTDETGLFQFLCYLEILKQLKGDNKGAIPQLIITETSALAKVVKQWLEDSNFEAEIQDSWLNYFHARGYFLYRWLKFIFVIFSQFLAAYFTRKVYPAKIFKGEPTIMINTHVFDYNFLIDGKFQDSCFPYLNDFLSKKGFKIIIYPFLYSLRLNFFKIYRKMRKCTPDFLLLEDFLCLSDYLNAFTYPLRFSRRKIKITDFRGFEVGPIIREIQKCNFTDSALRAILIYRSFKRIKKIMPAPEEVIVWYENQVIHKALIAGAKEAFANTGIIGAQSFIHSLNFLSFVPIISESEKNLTPDLLLTTSAYQSSIAGAFVKNIICQPAAALRYNHLFDDAYLNKTPELVEKPVILVLLPICIAEAVEMLETLNNTVKIFKHAQIMIKCHPAYSMGKIITVFGRNRWPSDFLVYEGKISEILEKATLVIGSNSSSMVEAAARGLPVIFISRQTALSSNFLSGIKTENVTVCYSGQDLVRAIQKYLNLDKAKRDEFRQLGREIRDMYFKPVTEENLLPFLALTNTPL